VITVATPQRRRTQRTRGLRRGSITEAAIGTCSAAAPWAILLGLFWLVLPIQLGGDTGFTVVSGRSMEPTYHTGDMIITKRASSYRPGDVVVYTIPHGVGAGRDIVHRIKQRMPDGMWMLQGDNNRSGDPWLISDRHIQGRLWLMIPQGARIVNFFRSVAALALAIGVLVAWVFWPGAEPREDGHDDDDDLPDQLLDDGLISDEELDRWLATLVDDDDLDALDDLDAVDDDPARKGDRGRDDDPRVLTTTAAASHIAVTIVLPDELVPLRSPVPADAPTQAMDDGLISDEELDRWLATLDTDDLGEPEPPETGPSWDGARPPSREQVRG
jgi:signal peptidase